jgi:hypothetical protein
MKIVEKKTVQPLIKPEVIINKASNILMNAANKPTQTVTTSQKPEVKIQVNNQNSLENNIMAKIKPRPTNMIDSSNLGNHIIGPKITVIKR